MRIVRRLVQLGFVVAVTWVAVGAVRGWTTGSAEKYCPLGGLATSWSFLTTGHLSCATSELNLALVGALLVLTVVVRKAFCSWVCPIGTIHEWLGAGGRRVRRLFSRKGIKTRPGIVAPPRAVDRGLRWLRLPTLVLVLAFSWTLAELVFRPYCPFYVTFGGSSHDVAAWSLGLIGGVFAVGIVVPMLWCRYLCPLGGALWPFAAVGRLRIRRDASSCTNCGLCSAVCPHGLDVAGRAEVRSGECTMCLECTYACTKREALHVGVGRSGKRLPRVAIPIAVAAAIGLGLTVGNLVSIPSYSQAFGSAAEATGDVKTATFEVEGIRCVDSARRASGQFEGVPGVLSFTAYASRHAAEVAFDSGVTDVVKLRRALEAPVFDAETGQIFFHVFKVVRVDDVPID